MILPQAIREQIPPLNKSVRMDVMKDDLAIDYTLRKWWRYVRANNKFHEGIRLPKKEPSWKSSFWLGVFWIAFGLVQIFTFREGLLEWWRIVRMSYEEVSKTPFLPLWTSGRAVTGFIWVFAGFSWLSQGLLKRRIRSENDSTT